MNISTIRIASLWVSLLVCTPSLIYGQGGGNSPLLLPELTQVAERDQLWNRVPNPKNPPAYLNNMAPAIPQHLLRNYLFVAVEPSNGLVELTITAWVYTGGSGPALYVGIRDITSTGTPILGGSAPLQSIGGTTYVAQLNFTPTGSVDNITYRVVMGFDNDGSGSLGNNEVITDESPQSGCFYIKAVTSSDYQDCVSWLTNRRHLISVYCPTATPFVDYFLSRTATMPNSTPLPNMVIPITSAGNPTHIAGSTYRVTDGETSIPHFLFSDGTAISNKVEDSFVRADHWGLAGAVYAIYDANRVALAAPYAQNPSLATNTSSPITFSCQPISFYGGGLVTDDLRFAFGEATISGTVTFGTRRDTTNPNNIYLTSVNIDATLDDVYDFDWTRPQNWPSRKASTVQIGFEPDARMAGAIFATRTQLIRLYNSGNAISDFNSLNGPINIVPTNPNPPVLEPPNE